MTLLSRAKYPYLIKTQPHTSFVSTKTLVWLVVMNVLILAFVSYYYLWNTFRIIEQEGRAQVQGATQHLETDIKESLISLQPDVSPSSHDQMPDFASAVNSHINDIYLSTNGLAIGYYDTTSDTYFFGTQNSSSIINLEPSSTAWLNYLNGQTTWYKTESAASKSKDKQVYINPVTQDELVTGYIWSSLEFPSFQFFAAQAALSSLILIFLATILIILIWHVLMKKINHSLIQSAQQIAKDPFHAQKEFKNPIFMPFKSYLESLHTKWLQAEQEYQAIERFHGMSEISAAVSHEIRNPLTTVRGFLQLFQTKSYLTEADTEIIQLMISELDHCTLLIKDFLDVTRPETKEFVAINLKDTLTRLIRVIEALALGHNVQINLELPQQDTYIKGNLQAFRQVLINLLQNAIQAMPSGGQIWLTVVHSDAEVFIRIRDTGIGMDQATLKNLGKPFFTTKTNGTGLGLPMCIHLITEMDGKLAFTSILGEGSVFILAFPTS